MMHSWVAMEPPHFRGGWSWDKASVQLWETCNWGDSSVMLWSKSNGWATAGDRGIGIEQSGNTLSNFPTRKIWETNFQRIWRHAFWRSIASGINRWMGRAMAGVGMWRSAQRCLPSSLRPGAFNEQ